MALLLAHEGHQVLRAHDAGAALELLSSDKTGRPDVLLVDLQMPGVSGGQLAEKVRALGSPGPLLLAMSATEVQRQQLLAFDGFLAQTACRGRPAPGAQTQKTGPQARSSRRPSGKDRDVVPATGEALDMAVIEKLLAMMPLQALQELFAACIADTRTCVRLSRTRCTRGGPASARLAHRIKGAASMVGAVRLARLAAGLEMGGSKEAATPGVLDDLLSACSELERMLLAGN